MSSKTMNRLAKSKERRDAFVSSEITVGLPFQIRALRRQRNWNQAELARAAGMHQPSISAIEQPGGGHLNLETLRRLASAFDVGLMVKFVPFSELVKFSEDFMPDTFAVLSFEEDLERVTYGSVHATNGSMRLVSDNKQTIREGPRSEAPLKLIQGTPAATTWVKSGVGGK